MSNPINSEHSKIPSRYLDGYDKFVANIWKIAGDIIDLRTPYHIPEIETRRDSGSYKQDRKRTTLWIPEIHTKK